MEKELVTQRRRAVKIIKELETYGGFRLPCNCMVSTNANEMRKLMEMVGPEVILEIATLLKCETCTTESVV